MLVKVKVKTLEHPQPDSSGAQRGDVVSLWPINRGHGSQTLKVFMIVVMDLNIPCGEEVFYNQPPPCDKCEYNYPDACDKSRYERGLWTAGALLEPPELIKKKQYRIDIASLVSADSKTLLFKEDRTEEEQSLILANAIKNPVSKTVIIDKDGA